MFKIFVGNLNQGTTEDAIRLLFGRYVEVEDVALPSDPDTGKLRGFAIVMIRDEQKAKAAMAAMRGIRLNGRSLIINQARRKGKAPPKRESRRRSFRVRPGGAPGADRSASGGGGFGRIRTFGTRPNPGRFGSGRSAGEGESGGPGAGAGA